MTDRDLDALDGLYPTDPLTTLLADLDQHLATLPHLAKMLGSEYHALVAEGVPVTAAAVMVGTRWSAT